MRYFIFVRVLLVFDILEMKQPSYFAAGVGCVPSIPDSDHAGGELAGGIWYTKPHIGRADLSSTLQLVPASSA